MMKGQLVRQWVCNMHILKITQLYAALIPAFVTKCQDHKVFYFLKVCMYHLSTPGILVMIRLSPTRLLISSLIINISIVIFKYSIQFLSFFCFLHTLKKICCEYVFPTMKTYHSK